MDIFSKYATDETKEVTGAEVLIGDVTFLIGRAGNQKYAKRLMELVDANQKVLNLKDQNANDVSDKIMVDVMAETILLGWDANLTYKGEVLPYSVENAKLMLRHKDFRKEIMMAADNFGNFQSKLEEEVKN